MQINRIKITRHEGPPETSSVSKISVGFTEEEIIFFHFAGYFCARVLRPRSDWPLASFAVPRWSPIFKPAKNA